MLIGSETNNLDLDVTEITITTPLAVDGARRSEGGGIRIENMSSSYAEV